MAAHQVRARSPVVRRHQPGQRQRRSHHPRTPLHLHTDHTGQPGRRPPGDHRRRHHLRQRLHHPTRPGRHRKLPHLPRRSRWHADSEVAHGQRRRHRIHRRWRPGRAGHTEPEQHRLQGQFRSHRWWSLQRHWAAQPGPQHRRAQHRGRLRRRSRQRRWRHDDDEGRDPLRGPTGRAPLPLPCRWPRLGIPTGRGLEGWAADREVQPGAGIPGPPTARPVYEVGVPAMRRWAASARGLLQSHEGVHRSAVRLLVCTGSPGVVGGQVMTDRKSAGDGGGAGILPLERRFRQPIRRSSLPVRQRADDAQETSTRSPPR